MVMDDNTRKKQPVPVLATEDNGDRLALDAKHHVMAMLDPALRHAKVAGDFTGRTFAGNVYGGKAPDVFTVAASVYDEIGKAGDLKGASRTLAAQAMTLDAMFTELARCSARNMTDYPSAAERYMRLALKAQSNCRATLESLARLHQPREQIVKHIHVNEGGQAVVADQFSHYGGIGNAKTNEQCHATGGAGDGSALPCPDPLGNGVPSPSRKGPEAVPHARGNEPWRA
jgi:hypothetical protein